MLLLVDIIPKRFVPGWQKSTILQFTKNTIFNNLTTPHWRPLFSITHFLLYLLQMGELLICMICCTWQKRQSVGGGLMLLVLASVWQIVTLPCGTSDTLLVVYALSVSGLIHNDPSKDVGPRGTAFLVSPFLLHKHVLWKITITFLESSIDYTDIFFSQRV